MPKKLIADMYIGYKEMIDQNTEPTVTPEPSQEVSQADAVAIDNEGAV